MFKNLIKSLYVLICGVIAVQLMGCGTILYPERKGQKSGRIDVGVALLDGIGLLFFFIPGIIAYAVDFNNGTIYLPGGRSSLELNDMKQVKFDPKSTTFAGIERIIQDETGQVVKLDQDNMNIIKLKSTDDMMAQFAKVLPEMQNDRMASVR